MCGSSPRMTVACCGAPCSPKVVVMPLQRLAFKMRNKVHLPACASENPQAAAVPATGFCQRAIAAYAQ